MCLVSPFGLKTCPKRVQILETGVDETAAWYVPSLLNDHYVDVGSLPDFFNYLVTIPSARFSGAFGAGVRQDRIFIANATLVRSWVAADGRAKAVCCRV